MKVLQLPAQNHRKIRLRKPEQGGGICQRNAGHSQTASEICHDGSLERNFIRIGKAEAGEDFGVVHKTEHAGLAYRVMPCGHSTNYRQAQADFQPRTMSRCYTATCSRDTSYTGRVMTDQPPSDGAVENFTGKNRSITSKLVFA